MTKRWPSLKQNCGDEIPTSLHSFCIWRLRIPWCGSFESHWFVLLRFFFFLNSFWSSFDMFDALEAWTAQNFPLWPQSYWLLKSYLKLWKPCRQVCLSNWLSVDWVMWFSVEAAWDLEESWKMPHRVWSYNALGYKVFAASLRCGFWAARLSMVCMNPVLYPGIPELNMCCGRSNRSPRFLGCSFVDAVKVVFWCSTWFWYCNCRSRLLCAVWLRRTRGFDRRPSHRTLRCWKDYIHFCSRLSIQYFLKASMPLIPLASSCALGRSMCIRKDSCQNAAIKRSISDIDTDVWTQEQKKPSSFIYLVPIVLRIFCSNVRFKQMVVGYGWGGPRNTWGNFRRSCAVFWTPW